MGTGALYPHEKLNQTTYWILNLMNRNVRNTGETCHLLNVVRQDGELCNKRPFEDPLNVSSAAITHNGSNHTV